MFAHVQLSIWLCGCSLEAGCSLWTFMAKPDFLCLWKKKVFALSFVYFNSWPVILTALPAVMVASRRCETRSSHLAFHYECVPLSVLTVKVTIGP